MKQIALQLYSARNTDTGKALDIIAAAGYQGVETFGGNMQDKKAFAAALAASGLHVQSMHIGLDQFADNMALCIEEAEQFNVSHLVCPYLAEEDRPSDIAGWQALAQQLAPIADAVVATGRQFAWHNHEFEFVDLGAGQTPMDLLLTAVPKMQWEIDLGWIQRAGQNPVDWLVKYQDRVSAVHLKDVAKDGDCLDEDGWADVGAGVIDWSSLQAPLQNVSAAHWIVEHDNPSDLNRFVTQSIQSIKSW